MSKNYPYYEHIKINNLSELLRMHLPTKQDDIAFSFRDKNKIIVNKTYSEFYYDVNRMSNYLAKKYKNEHIAIVGENSYNWIVLFFAIIISSNVVVIIDKDLSSEVIIKLLKNTDTKIVFYSKNYSEFLDKSRNLKKECIEDIDSWVSSFKNQSSESLKRKMSSAIFFTSGTTGFNKGVVLSEKNIVEDIYGACSLFKPEGTILSMLPFHHTFGFITAVLMPFYYGKTVFINTSLKYIKDDFKDSKPETIFVVPAFVESFYKQIWNIARKTKKDKILKRSIGISNGIKKIGIDLRKQLFKSISEEFGGNLRHMICGGAFLDKKYVQWFRSIGIDILNGYGITECSPVVSVNRNNFYKDGSIGLPVRGAEIKIINDEICVKGDIVMDGYYKDKKATNEVIKDGYFYTGDLGYIDEDGFIFITGRKKNLIILSNGENVSPEMIEEELGKDEGIKEIVIYEKNNKIIASIYPSDEYMGNEEYFNDLIDQYNKRVPVNHQVAFVTLRNKEHIKNNNYKILRNKVEE